jgi:MFS family permease
LSGAVLLNLWKRPALELKVQEPVILLIGAFVVLVGLTGLAIHKSNPYVRASHLGPPILLSVSRVLVIVVGGLIYLSGLTIVTISFSLAEEADGWGTVVALFQAFLFVSTLIAPLCAICSYCRVRAEEGELPTAMYILPWFDYRA